jgi:DNA polymerase elongation subunit (family B)
MKLIPADHEPYFFIRKKDESIFHDNPGYFGHATLERGDFISATSREPMLQVLCHSPLQVKVLREFVEQQGFMTMESDIVYADRWMMDKKIQPPMLKPEYLLSFDVEVDARSGFPRAQYPEQRIIGIGLVDGRGKEQFICNSDEVQMYYDFINIAKKYPILTGWNIEKFDVPYLKARAEKIGVKFDVGLSSFVDGMVLYQLAGYARGQSSRLDDVISRELGKKIKKEFETLNRMQQMWDAFVHDRKKLEDYCMDDTRSVAQLMLDPKYQIIELNVVKARIAHARYSHLAKISRLVESYRMGLELERSPRHVFPKHEWVEEGGKPELGGGYVFDPIVGIHRWVAVLDFSGMYSRLMRMFNIDLESLIEIFDINDASLYVSPDSSIAFVRHPDSGNRILLSQLEKGKLDERTLQNTFQPGTKDYMLHYILSAAYKVFGLSFYGVLGSEYSRFFDIRVANAITAWGRECINVIADLAKAMGYVVTYGDTDSVFIDMKSQLPEAAKTEMEKLAPVLNEGLKQYLVKKYRIDPDDYIMDLEAEKLFDRFYIPAKKAYIGRFYIPEKQRGQLFSRGMDLVKYGVFPLLKTVQKEMFDTLFAADDMNSANSDIAAYFSIIRKELFSGKIDEQLVMKRGVRQALNAYQVSSPHVTAANKLAKHGLFREGDIVNYVVTDIIRGQQNTEPIVDILPKIQPRGYSYYYERLTDMRDKVLGGEEKSDLKKWM